MAGPLDSVIENVSPWFEELYIVAYLIGFVLIVQSLVQLSPHGKRALHGEEGMGKVLATLFGGLFLMSFPALLDALSLTIFGETTVTALSDVGGMGGSADPSVIYRQVTVIIVQVVGVIGIIRGCVLLSRSGHDGRSFPQAITHLVGGIMAVNYLKTVLLLADLFKSSPEVSGALKAMIGQ